MLLLIFFYMGINIGAMFAPHVARYLKNLMMENSGFTYDSAIPKIANDLIAGHTVTAENLTKLQTMAHTTDSASLIQFAQKLFKCSFSWIQLGLCCCRCIDVD